MKELAPVLEQHKLNAAFSLRLVHDAFPSSPQNTKPGLSCRASSRLQRHEATTGSNVLRTVLLEESKMFYSTKMISPAAKSASTRLSVEHFEPAQAHGLGHFRGGEPRSEFNGLLPAASDSYA